MVGAHPLITGDTKRSAIMALWRRITRGELGVTG